MSKAWYLDPNAIVAIMQGVSMVVGLVERLFLGLPGKEKRTAAIKVAKEYTPVGPGGEAVPDAVIADVIESQVAYNNQTGVFKHKTKAPQEAPPV